MTKKERYSEVIAWFEKNMPIAESELNFSNPFELLVAVVLSAQCTDERVNKITAQLFKEYNTPEKMITLSQEDLEKHIFSCGLYHSKAKSIKESCTMLRDEYGGVLPDTMDELEEYKALSLAELE